jgi:hypothetical protein
VSPRARRALEAWVAIVVLLAIVVLVTGCQYPLRF